MVDNKGRYDPSSFFILDIEKIPELFGFFMLVIIGVELLETIMKIYLAESVDRVKIVMAVAIIAISRKVIILDLIKCQAFHL